MNTDASNAVTAARFCIGCRQRGERDVLLRFVLAGDPPTVVPDVRRRANGRGASTHASYRCVARAVDNGGFQRAFKRPLKVSAHDLSAWARGQYQRRIEGLVQAAYRAGALILGSDQVREALSEARPALLLVTEDAAGRRDELMNAAKRLGRRCIVFGDKRSLGALLGRTELGVVAVLDEGIAAEMHEAAHRVAELAEEA